MVLDFINTIVITGGSVELRTQCIEEMLEYGQVERCCDRISDLPDSSKINVISNHSPIDNILLDLASKYLALDFEVEFKPNSDNIFKDWQGCLRVVDQLMYFSDNYEASEGYELGSMYKLTSEGGFPDCLEKFHK